MSKIKKVTFGDCWKQFVETPAESGPLSAQYDKIRSCTSKKGSYVDSAIADKAAVANSSEVDKGKSDDGRA
jgi:hypothetical protein